MNQTSTAFVNKDVPRLRNRHLPVTLGDGSYTSVSIHPEQYADYVRRLGGDAQVFRTELNAAALSAKPRLGITRSLAVRLALEERIEQLELAETRSTIGAISVVTK